MKTNRREDKVVEAVETTAKKSDGLIHLSTGVVLEPKRVPNMLFAEVIRKFKRPSVPRMLNKDLGREMDNPDDPAYIEKLAEYNNEISMAIVDLMIVAGTTVYSVPKSMSSPDDKKWTDDMDVILAMIIGDVELTGKKRYLYWVKFYAGPSETDIAEIMEGVGRLSGVSEEDVSDAISRFRNNT